MKKRCKATTYNIEGNFSLNFLSLMELRYHKNNFETKINFYVVGSSLTQLFQRDFYTVCTREF